MHYWILTVARSGSSFIAGELRRRLGGEPLSTEFFNVRHVASRQDFIPSPDAPVRGYLEYLAARHAIRGVLGVKMVWPQIEQCCRYPDFLPAIAGGRIVHLRRRDVIQQGISLFFAMRTGAWKSSTQPRLERPDAVEYDHAAIGQCVEYVETSDALLRRFLAVHALDHLPVWYEDFVADPEAESDRILAYLGLARAVSPGGGGEIFDVQSTDRSREFRERFLEDERRRMRGDGTYRGPPVFPEEPSAPSGECAAS